MMYFTSDWHIGEEQNPCTHSYLRPYPTSIMVQYWLQQCHERLKPEDELVFVGDVGITLADLGVLRSLPECEKILVLGDKETNSAHFTLSEYEVRNRELGIFNSVTDTLTLEINGRDYFVAHKPEDCLPYCASENMAAICGHVHGIWRTQRLPNGLPIINVGIDAWGGLVSEDFIDHQYDCVTKGYYDVNCFAQDW